MHVVLNTDTLGALGASENPVGPISSAGHRSCCRSCVTSAGLLWKAFLCKGVCGVPPGCSPGPWGFCGFLALPQFLVFHPPVSLCGINRGVLPYLMEVLGVGAHIDAHKDAQSESWYTFDSPDRYFMTLFPLGSMILWQCWGQTQLFSQGAHNL